MPRSRSTAIQSERTRRRSPRAFPSPANWIPPPKSSNFSVSVVLPASGCEMIAKVRRREISSVSGLTNQFQLLPGSDCLQPHSGCGNRRHLMRLSPFPRNQSLLG